MRILQLTKLPDFYTRYDLAIKDTHNFVANGVVVHNTSAHISFKRIVTSEGPTKIEVHYFAGGEKHDNFVALFDDAALRAAFDKMGVQEVTIFGEAYGGKQQGMSQTYGPHLKFCAFDVKVGECWLNVPKAEKVAKDFGLEFVFYEEIPTDIESLDAARNRESTQAIRNGCGPGKKTEGVVLRPLEEFTKNNGDRIIVKYKNPDFSERKSGSDTKLTDPDKLEKMTKAQAVADEFITEMRMTHVLDKIPAEKRCMENMKGIIEAMTEDVLREGADVIVDSKEVRAAIGKATAIMFKRRLAEDMRQQASVTGQPVILPIQMARPDRPLNLNDLASTQAPASDTITISKSQGEATVFPNNRVN